MFYSEFQAKLQRNVKQLVALAVIALPNVGLSEDKAAAPAAVGVESQVAAPKVTPSVEVKPTIRVSEIHERKQKDDGKHIVPKTHFRPALSVHLADPGVEFLAVGYFYKMTDSTAMMATRPYELYANFDTVKLGLLEIDPFVLYYTPFKEAAAQTLLGAYNSVSSPVLSSSIGTLKVKLADEIGVGIASREEKVSYKREANPVLGLDQSSSITGKKKDSDFYHEASVTLEYKAPIKGLKLVAENFLTNSYSTKYTLDAEGNESENYLNDQSSTQRLRLSYMLSDRLMIRNDVYAFQKGFLKKASGTDLANELQLVYSM